MHPTETIRNLPSSYIREILQAATALGCLSLAGGLPNEGLFPCDALSRILADMAGDVRAHAALFQYGLTQGHAPLLAFLKAAYTLPDDHELMITTGSQQGIDLVARCFLEKGEGVALEVPSYLGAIQAFALTGAQLHGVTQNADGPDVEQLEARFKSGRCKFFYAVPDFHNPTGRCWSRAIREQVAQLCTKYNVLLLEDAPYRELRFSGGAQPMVSSFCPNHAIVLRSFSKTALPGLRLASLTGPEKLLKPLLRIKQAMDLHTHLPGQFILHRVLSDSQFAEHVQALCSAYQARCEALCEALRCHLSRFGRFEEVQGGMFVWFKLFGLDASTVASRALEHGVAVVPSPVFYHQQCRAEQALRLNFSHLGVSQLGEAAQRLAVAMQASGS